MKKEFVTYFDSNYAACGIAMLESLFQWHESIHATVLCLDDEVANIIASELGERVRTVSTGELADYEPALQALKGSRDPWEFYATHKPVLLDWVMSQQPAGTLLAYTDADTFYFSDPAPLFEETGTASIALSPHRFNAATQHLSAYGTYNAGFGIWRTDAIGRQCLQDWTRDCLQWCHSRVEEDGRFMNQGYLNHWPSRYKNVHILTHPGANLAPWNVDTHVLDKTSGVVRVDSQPLIFYHFSGLSRNAQGIWQTYDQGGAMQQAALHQGIYTPYIKALEAVSQRLQDGYWITGLGSVRPTEENIPMITFEASS